MLTKSGVKLLDFGLAKALPGADRDPALTAMATSSQPLTGHGTIVGTLHYMAPEQLEGKDADTRSDIFAFGAVLYEMVTRRKAFEGKSAATVIAAIVEREPPAIKELQPMAPPALDRVVKICLAKDPDDRWQTAHDVGLELKWILEGGSQAGLPAPVIVHRKKRERAAWIIAGLCTIALLIFLGLYLAASRSRPSVVVSSILPPPGTHFSFVGSLSGVPQISPDDDTLLLNVVDANGEGSLWLRPLNSASARPLQGTQGAESPFWSPDGKSIGFFAGGKLKTISVSGGPVMSLADASIVSGGTWNQQGIILFAPALDSGIYQVAAGGGSPQLLISIDKSKFTGYISPRFLPDGNHFTYSAFGAEAIGGTYFASLDRRENKLVTRDNSNTAYSSGFLFYALSGPSSTDLMALPFDSSSGRVKGEPKLMAQAIQFLEGPERAAFAVSDRLLVYQPSPPGATALHNLLWLDRTGKKISTVAPAQDSFDLRLSPDGQRLAYAKGGPNSDIWIQDLKRDVPMRITFDPSVDKGAPIWSPDGSQLLFDVALGGTTPPGIYRKASSGTGAERPLAQPNQPGMVLWPTDWSRDGRFVLAAQGEIIARARGEIWIIPMAGDGKPRIFVRAPGAAYDGQFSPDGHWVAYVSRESGREEVYVVPFDAALVLKTQPMQEVTITGKWQVSAKGGSFPRWRRDGQELYFVAPGHQFMAARIQAKTGTFSVLETTPLFRESLAQAAAPYDVSFDGQRFVVNSFGDTASLALTLVTNWKESLKQ